MVGSAIGVIAVIIAIVIVVRCLKRKNQSHEKRMHPSQQLQQPPYAVMPQPMMTAPVGFVGASPALGSSPYMMTPPDMSSYQLPSQPPSYHDAVEGAGSSSNHQMGDGSGTFRNEKS